MAGVTVAVWAALAGIFGLAIGSFLNVVIYRVPVGESVVSPPSKCPSCGSEIHNRHNIPVLGWLILRGRCFACHAPISPRYPIVEALTGVLYALVVWARWDDASGIALGIVLVTALIPIALIDFEYRIIPNRITGPAAIVAILIGVVLDQDYVVEQLIAGAAAGGFFFLALLAYPKGMGMGDVKLAGMMGLYLGRAVGLGVLVGLVAGVVVGSVIMARLGVRAGRKQAVPFGPFLALGGLVAIFAGDAVADSYANHF
jgi:leader peptidase (prepilin peptidase)/N-methyltransferase